MCCIFTCCGWLVDLVQRLWTFTMSCCISSSICCLLAVGSMSGIALGYNYSLAEYMDLKETNVSIYLKRGVFDDDLAELEWRRAGHIPVRGYQNKGLKGLEGDILEAEGTTVRSGRRLDDSVVDLNDQNKYEGSLFKLTAKPPIEMTTMPHITGDSDMERIASSYTRGSLDSLKAIQSIIDARRAMAQQFRGTTVSPVPTYPFQEAERMMYPGMMGGRREMQDINDFKAPLNPARAAVPSDNIGSRRNWMVPKYPHLPLVTGEDKGLLYIPETRATYPSAIPLRTGPIRPTPSSSSPLPDNLVILTRTQIFTLFSTAPTDVPGVEVHMPDQNPTIETLKEKLMMENELPIRKQKPKPEEEYDYDIKGLPVRKRRSIKTKDTHDEKKGNSLHKGKVVAKEQDPHAIKNRHDDLNHIVEDRDPIGVDAIKESVEEVNQPTVIELDSKYNPNPKIQAPDQQKISFLKNGFISNLISKIRSFFELNANGKPIVPSRVINEEINKTISEHETKPKSMASVNTEQIMSKDDKISDNILRYLYSDKQMVKSTPSLLVDILLSTIT